jgi:hypothetical protein
VQQALGNEEREVRVDVTGRFEAFVERLLNQLPDRVAVRPNHHTALDGRIVGELGAAHDVQIPLREILRAGRDLRHEGVFAALVLLFGDDLSDLRVVVGRDGAHVGDVLALDRLGHLVQRLDRGLDGGVDAPLQLHRVGAGGDVLDALAVDRLREHGRGRRAVAGDVGGLGSDLADHLRAHVLERVLQLDLLGDSDAVLGDRRGPELLLDDDVAPLGAEGDFDGVGELVDAVEDALARLLAVGNCFSSHCLFHSFRILTSR